MDENTITDTCPEVARLKESWRADDGTVPQLSVFLETARGRSDCAINLIKTDAIERFRLRYDCTLKHYLSTLPGWVVEHMAPGTDLAQWLIRLHVSYLDSRALAASAIYLRITSNEEYEPDIERILQSVEAHNGRNTLSVLGVPTIDSGQCPLVDRFGLLEYLGGGGFGEVWVAWDCRLKRTVAIKLLYPTVVHTSSDLVERILDEARAASETRHKAAVQVYEARLSEAPNAGIPIIVMTLCADPPERDDLASYPWNTTFSNVVARPLTEIHSRDKLCNVQEAIRIVVDVSGAVSAAHKVGRFHCDLTPRNVLMSPRTGDVWLTDFGLSRRQPQPGTIAQSTQYYGTPGFMPPEQSRGESPTVQSDVFGLGGLLYYLLSQLPPYPLRSDADSLHARLEVLERTKSQPPTVSLPARLSRSLHRICARALAFNPGDRYESVSQFVEDLQAWQRIQPPTHAGPIPHSERIHLWCKRNRVWFIPVIIALLILITTTVWYVSSVRSQRTLAEHNARVSESRRVAMYASQFNDRPQLGTLLSVEAVQQSLRFGESVVAEAEQALRYFLDRSGGYPLREIDFTLASIVRVGKDSLLACGEDGRVELWDMRIALHPQRTLITKPSGDRVTVFPCKGGQAVVSPSGVVRILSDGEVKLETKIDPDDAKALTRDHIVVTADGSVSLLCSSGRLLRWMRRSGAMVSLDAGDKFNFGSVSKAKLASNGRWLAANDNKTFLLFRITPDGVQSEPLRSMPGGTPDTIEFADSGARVAVAFHAGVVCVLGLPEIGTPSVIDQIAYSGTGSPRVRLNSSGSILVMAHKNGEVFIRRTDDPVGHILRCDPLPFRLDWGVTLEFVDSDRLLFINDGSRNAAMYSLEPPSQRLAPVVLHLYSDTVTHVSYDVTPWDWSSQSRRLVTLNTSGDLHLWSFGPTLKDRRSTPLPGHDARIHRVCMLGDGNTLMSLGEDGVRVWLLEESPTRWPQRLSVGRIQNGQTLTPWRVVGAHEWRWSANSKWLLVLGTEQYTLWHIKGNKGVKSAEFDPHAAGIPVALSQKLEYMVTRSSAGDRHQLWTLGADRAYTRDIVVQGVDACLTDSYLLEVTGDGMVWYTRLKDPFKRLLLGDSHLRDPGKIFGTDQIVVIESKSGDSATAVTGPEIKPYHTSELGFGGVYTVSRISDANAALVNDDAVVRLCDGGIQIAQFGELKSNRVRVGSSYIIEQLKDGEIRGWDLAKWPLSWDTLSWPSDYRALHTAAATTSKSTSLVAVRGDDKSIGIIGLNGVKGELGLRLETEAGVGQYIEWSADGAWLLAAGPDGRAYLWNTRERQLRPARLPAHWNSDITKIGFSPDGRWVVTGAEDNSLNLHPTSVETLLEGAAEVTGRKLSADEWRLAFPGIPYPEMSQNARK